LEIVDIISDVTPWQRRGRVVRRGREGGLTEKKVELLIFFAGEGPEELVGVDTNVRVDVNVPLEQAQSVTVIRQTDRQVDPR
jgi:hypothetical protein